MIKQANFIAPTNDMSMVENCKVTWVNVIGPANPVVSTINNSSFTVVNYTLTDEIDQYGIPRRHLLHPGKVTRTVREMDGKVVVLTEGEGTGFAPFLNTFFSGFVWGGVDEDLKEYWDENSGT